MSPDADGRPERLSLDELMADGERIWPGHWVIHRCVTKDDGTNGLAVHHESYHCWCDRKRAPDA